MRYFIFILSLKKGPSEMATNQNWGRRVGAVGRGRPRGASGPLRGGRAQGCSRVGARRDARGRGVGMAAAAAVAVWAEAARVARALGPFLIRPLGLRRRRGPFSLGAGPAATSERGGQGAPAWTRSLPSGVRPGRGAPSRCPPSPISCFFSFPGEVMNSSGGPR